ncbi:hypothetical protein [Streptomyces sp. NPDC048266]|uniref:hypothetical protein n=1 Tax=unclassified Streptomyces TaxID=2593676 RepID=UPI0033E958F6
MPALPGKEHPDSLMPHPARSRIDARPVGDARSGSGDLNGPDGLIGLNASA